MSEMVNRVAQAIMDAVGPLQQSAPQGQLGGMTLDQQARAALGWDAAVSAARAAIAAMREPTPEMIRAAAIYADIVGERVSSVMLTAGWGRMIDTALR